MNEKIKDLENTLKQIMAHTKELAHGEETKGWLSQITPNADWQILIAALAHDIERAVPAIAGMTPDAPRKEKGDTYDDYKAKHARRSATIVRHIMCEMGFSEHDINRVFNAIEKHEIGGDEDSDLVRDADSIRWFAVGHTRYIDSYGLDAAKEKGWWMYKRASEATKKLIDSISYAVEIKMYIANKKDTSIYT